MESKRWVTDPDVQASCSTTPTVAQELKWRFVIDANDNENVDVTLSR